MNTFHVYLPFSLEDSVTPISDSASVPVAMIGFIFSGLPNPHRGSTTNAHNTSERPRKANTRGCRIQTPYWLSALLLPVMNLIYMIGNSTSDTDSSAPLAMTMGGDVQRHDSTTTLT